jgi:hypothetical protein
MKNILKFLRTGEYRVVYPAVAFRSNEAKLGKKLETEEFHVQLDTRRDVSSESSIEDEYDVEYAKSQLNKGIYFDESDSETVESLFAEAETDSLVRSRR